MQTPCSRGAHSFFEKLAETAKEPEARRSCFLVNSVLEVARNNPQVKEHVSRYLDRVEELFRSRRQAARECGELAADKDPEALAALLMTNIRGLRVLLAVGAEPRKVRAVAAQILRLFD